MLNARNILIYLSVKFEGDFFKIYDFISKKEKHPSEEEIEEVLRSIKAHTVTILDADYPEYLKNVCRPPFVLFYYGDFSLAKNINNNIAIVGSRNCTSYGIKHTEEIVGKIADRYRIVSGMARGIDTCAHNACILNKGKTIAILGSGIDYCYPASNKDLYDELKRNHLVISEYPNKTKPKENNFPFRNRLIVAFSSCVVITQAELHSGTSITCSYALSAGKEVCCVPFYANKTSLCNQLIKDGARLIEDGDDLLSLLDQTITEPDFEL